MGALDAVLERKLSGLRLPLAVLLPGGQRLGPERAAVTLRLKDYAALAPLVAGQVGEIGAAYVEGRVDIDGAPRDIAAVAAALIGDDPTRPPGALSAWWRMLWRPLCQA